MASQTSSLKKGQREAFFSIVDTWFSAAADYLSLLGGGREDRGVLDIPDAELEILYRQTVLTRAIDRKSASRFAETQGRKVVRRGTSRRDLSYRKANLSR